MEQNPATTTYESKLEFKQKMDDLHEVRAKTAYTLAGHAATNKNKDDHQRRRAERVCGKPISFPGERGPWQRVLSRYLTSAMPKGKIWNNKARARLEGLVRQYEEKFGWELCRIADGAPWIGLEEDMPADLCWNLWALF